MTLAVWADSPDVPTTVCFDARLVGASGGPAYPGGTTAGQGGWDVGIHFNGLSDLADKLSRMPVGLPAPVCGNWYQNCPPIARGQVTRLAINAHGLPGQLYVSGVNGRALTADNAGAFHADLHAIGLATSETAMILLMGCMAGKGEAGTLLLRALQGVWPGRTIVAFSTVGYSHAGGMYRSGAQCTEPGMRDTLSPDPSLSTRQSYETYGPIWNDLKKLPWASETSPGAKVIKDGQIVRGG